MRRGHEQGFASNLQRVSSSLVLFVTLSGCALHAPKPAFDLGRFSAESLDTIIAGARELNSTGDRIEFISREFLGIRYREHRLIGDSDTPETLTVNLAALDCYTYLDYVEALRRSTAYSDFEAQLVGVRYKGGRVGWRARRPLSLRLGDRRRCPAAGCHRRDRGRCDGVRCQGSQSQR